MEISSRTASFPRTAALLGLAALSTLGLAAARPAVAQSYTYTTITSADLGTPDPSVTGNEITEAVGITNAGVVVGIAATGPLNSTISAYPSVGYEYDTTSGAATLINYQSANFGPALITVSGDGSQILGYYNPGGNGPNTYFTDSSGHISGLPDPYTLTGEDPSIDSAAYYGINSSGTTVGLTTVNYSFQGFLRGADGTLTIFSDPNDDTGTTFADGINASGTVSGYYQSSANGYSDTGFLRSADGTFTDFNVPGATDTYLSGLSDNGNLFGQYDVMNPDGSFPIYNFTYVNGVLNTSIDVPGARYTDITGINDAGQISGYYGDGKGNTFGFYGDFNPVPEASTTVSFGLLLALGLGGVVVAAKKKQAVADA